MNLKYWLLLPWLLLYLSESVAQAVPNLHFHHLTRKEGLIQGWNWHMLKDSRGEVWISSTNGLNRFDGVSVQTYTPDERLPGSIKGQNIAGKFVEDPKGDVWFGADAYLCRYERIADTFAHYPIILAKKTLQALCHVITRDASGKFWLLIEDEDNEYPILTFDPENQVFELKDTIGHRVNRCIAQTNKDGMVTHLLAFLWGSSTASIISFPQTTNQKTPNVINLDQQTTPSYGAILEAEFSPPSSFYLLTDKGLYTYALNTCRGYPLLLEPNLCSMASGSDGQIWLSTKTGKIIQFDLPENKVLNTYEPDPTDRGSLKPDPIYHLYIDSDGTIWAGYFSEGVSWVNPAKSKFKIIKIPGTKQALSSLFRDQSGGMHGSWGNSLYAINGQNITKTMTLSPTDRDIDKVEMDTKGRVWMHNGFSLQLYYPKTRQQKNVLERKAPYTQVIDFKILKNNSLLVATYSDLFQLVETSEGKFQHKPMQALPPKSFFTSVFEDQSGKLYVAHDMSEIWVLQKVNGEYALAKTDSLPIKGDINGWHEDQDNIWIATSNGLVCLNKSDFGYQVFKQKDGLPSLLINNIISDGADGLWLSDNDRFIHFDKKTKNFHQYTLADGLPSNGFISKLSCEVRPGVYWFGTKGGIVEVEKRLIRSFPVAPHVRMKQILVNDSPDSTLRCNEDLCANPGEIGEIVLPYSKRTLSFSFVSSEYSSPGMSYLQYQIQGLDDTWITTPNPGFIRLANLPIGTFQLNIKAYSEEGISNDKPYSLKIIIEPPFYRTWWFYALVILTVLGAAWGFYRYRIQQIKKLDAMRQQITADLHDEIGPFLTGIRMFSDSLRLMMGSENAEASKMLERIGANAHKTLSSFRDIIWAVNIKYDSVSDLADRMRELVNEANESSPIFCRFSTEILNPDLNINPRLRHNVFLIFKETLHNSLKSYQYPVQDG
jgi:ligand-binding sensor domain-containing protein